MLAICGPGWKSVPGTCQGRGGAGSRCQAPAKDAAGLEVGARHLPRTRRDASNLRAGLEVGARHLSKDAAGC
jgi:hypothetical protein